MPRSFNVRKACHTLLAAVGCLFIAGCAQLPPTRLSGKIFPPTSTTACRLALGPGTQVRKAERLLTLMLPECQPSSSLEAQLVAELALSHRPATTRITISNVATNAVSASEPKPRGEVYALHLRMWESASGKDRAVASAEVTYPRVRKGTRADEAYETLARLITTRRVTSQETQETEPAMRYLALPTGRRAATLCDFAPAQPTPTSLADFDWEGR